MAGDRLRAPCIGAPDPTAQSGPCTSVCLYHVCHQLHLPPTCCRPWAPVGCSCSPAGQSCPTGPAGGQPAAGRLAPAARPAGAGWMDALKGVNNHRPFVGTPHPTYPHPLLTLTAHFPERPAAPNHYSSPPTLGSFYPAVARCTGPHPATHGLPVPPAEASPAAHMPPCLFPKHPPAPE